jgi:hypothetical protein
VLRARGLAACLSAVGLLACAGDVQVQSDPAHDWSHSTTWGWLPLEAEALLPDPPLRAALADAVEQQLAAHGLARGASPDLYVVCRVRVEPEQVLRTETPAEQFVPSLHGGAPSFVVLASRQVLIRYERVALTIEISDARTRQAVWRGHEEERVRGAFLPHAARSVASLLAHLPKSSAARALIARIGRPGYAPSTSAPSRTTSTPPTSTSAIPADG